MTDHIRLDNTTLDQIVIRLDQWAGAASNAEAEEAIRSLVSFVLANKERFSK